jgi:predicted phosphodiesterase
MRYAIFSDIHANLPAWRAIRADMVALEAEVLVCLGDAIGYGPLPEQVLSEIREVSNNFVLGNHDAAAVGIMDPSLFNDNAEAIIRWTSAQLREDSKEFLKDAPLTIEGDDMLFVHAEIAEPGRFGYIEGEADAMANFAAGEHFVTFIGHTHHPTLFDLAPDGVARTLADQDCSLDPAHRYIVNVGSVGEPRNPDDIRARYVVYDSETRELFFRRVEFDVEAYRRDLAATSLNITPYFLHIVDEHVASTAAMHAMTADMQLPQNYVVQPASRRLVLPHPAAARIQQLPQTAYQPPAKKNGTTVAVLIVMALLVAIGAIIILPSKDATDGDVASNESETPAKRERKQQSPNPDNQPRIDPYRAAELAQGNPASDAPEDEPEPEPEPERVIEPGPLAFQFDIGGTFTRYDGANSPAHAAGILPETHNHWISVNDGKANGGVPQEVQSASGEDYSKPLMIEMGAEVLGTSESDAVKWSGPTIASDPPRGASGIFESDLMDGVHHASGNKSVAVRIAGLPAGNYSVYLTPVTGELLGREFRYGVGVDKEGTVDRLGPSGLTPSTYEAGSATLEDGEWTEGINYFKHQVEIRSKTDFVVALVEMVSNKPGGLPYLQIVRDE